VQHPQNVAQKWLFEDFVPDVLHNAQKDGKIKSFRRFKEV